MKREYVQKIAEEILQVAKANWNNLIVLKKLYAELEHRSSNAGLRVRQIVAQRIHELEKQNTNKPTVWPTTDAPAGQRGFTGEQFWYDDGLLSYVGYRVGNTRGVHETGRREILRCVLFNELPRVHSPDYMNEWGAPKSFTRLMKLAESIASFTRNAKRKDPNSMRAAIEDWENDLAFLRKTLLPHRARLPMA